MLEKVRQFILENQLFSAEDNLLLAISGGADSVCLAHVLSKLNYNFELVHCNFQLRGEESLADEKFVRHLAVDLEKEISVKRFDMNDQESIQLQARNVRYAWFAELVKEKKGILLTAHHRSDVLETILINLGRGTGLAGLHGILPKNDRGVVRPLLCVTKEEILEYCTSNDLTFREDSSNASDKYLRNKIRHKVVPALKEVFPEIETTIWNTTASVREAEELLNENVSGNESVLRMEKEKGYISLDSLNKSTNPLGKLYQILKSYGFSKAALKGILDSKQSGKQVESNGYVLLMDRRELILYKKEVKQEEVLFSFQAINQQVEVPFGKIKVEVDAHLPDLKNITKQDCYLDSLLLEFPLTLRKWQQGDRFVPLGMQGKKKISDFLIDKKVPLADKESVWVLCSGKDIAWVVNHRLDDRFKVTEETEEVIKLSVLS